MKPPEYRSRLTRRRGAMVVLVTICLATFMICAALTVDVGRICVVNADQQNTADAAALAGVSAIRDMKPYAATNRALATISEYQDSQGFSSLSDQIVEIGRWDAPTAKFTTLTSQKAASANAVRVVAKRSQVSLFFARIMGIDNREVSRSAIARVTPSCNGVWGISGVNIPGNVTIDSYDSSDGIYQSATADVNGDVCSNLGITVQGSADINGDVLSATGDVTLVGGAYTITGVYEEQIHPIGVSALDFTGILHDNNLIGLTDNGLDPLDGTSVSKPGLFDLILGSNDNLTLASGTYLFDDIVLNGTSSLTLTGPTTIYVEDDITMAGGTTLNTTLDPKDLTIIADGDTDGSTLAFSGNADFYGAIYAPFSTVTWSGTLDFYGTVISDILDFTGDVAVHVDESLELVNELKGPIALVE